MSGDDSEDHDDDEWQRRYSVQAELFAQEQVRRRRIARWFLIPYCLCGAALGVAIGLVFNAGMVATGFTLAGAFVVMASCQWIAPILVQRGEKS